MNPIRFKRIMAFITTYRNREGYTEEIIARALAKLLYAIKRNLVVGAWWPYAEVLVKKAYTEDQQGQSAKYKKGGAESLKELFERMKG